MAQDVIVKKDSATIVCKVLEITSTEVKYKKISNQNGPTYSLPKTDIQVINYENGERECFDTTQQDNLEQSSTPKIIIKEPDARNEELIAKYNQIYEPSTKIKRSKKTADRCLIFIGVKQSSVMSNEDIEMNIVAKKKVTPYGADCWCHGIKLQNKTDRTIYIDKACCFRLSSEESEYCYYNNLSSKRIVNIPPNSSAYLVEEAWEKDLWIEGFERFRFKTVKPNEIGIYEGMVNLGEIRTFEEEELPWNRKYIITYSFDESFSTVSGLYASLYIKEIMGCQGLISPMCYRPGVGGLVECEIKYDKYIEDFNTATIVGYHKFNTVQSVYHASTYATESINRKSHDEAQIARAITGGGYNPYANFWNNASYTTSSAVPAAATRSVQNNIYDEFWDNAAKEAQTQQKYIENTAKDYWEHPERHQNTQTSGVSGSSTTTRSHQTSSSGHQCRLCGGSGRKVRETWTSDKTSTKWCSECSKKVGLGHSHTQCDLCHGSGWIK